MSSTPDLTLTERLILANQYEILSHQASDRYTQSKYRRRAKQLKNGHTWLYQDIFKDVHEDLDENDTNFVLSVLDLHAALLNSYDQLSDNGISTIHEREVTFKGFHRTSESHLLDFVLALDNEGHYRTVIKAGAWPSANPMTDTYKKMLARWNQLRNQQNLSNEQILEIIGI